LGARSQARRLGALRHAAGPFQSLAQRLWWQLLWCARTCACALPFCLCPHVVRLDGWVHAVRFGGWVHARGRVPCPFVCVLPPLTGMWVPLCCKREPCCITTAKRCSTSRAQLQVETAALKWQACKAAMAPAITRCCTRVCACAGRGGGTEAAGGEPRQWGGSHGGQAGLGAAGVRSSTKQQVPTVYTHMWTNAWGVALSHTEPTLTMSPPLLTHMHAGRRPADSGAGRGTQQQQQCAAAAWTGAAGASRGQSRGGGACFGPGAAAATAAAAAK